MTVIIHVMDDQTIDLIDYVTGIGNGTFFTVYHYSVHASTHTRMWDARTVHALKKRL